MKQQEIKAFTQDELLEQLAQQQKTYAEAKFSHSYLRPDEIVLP